MAGPQRLFGKSLKKALKLNSRRFTVRHSPLFAQKLRFEGTEQRENAAKTHFAQGSINADLELLTKQSLNYA